MTDTPERIWLLPDAGNDGETLWCDNPAPGAGMSPEDAVEYVRADLVPQWLPIETAPKDGTIIDVWVPGHGRECDVWHDDCWSFPGMPSHWMPLPAAPEGVA